MAESCNQSLPDKIHRELMIIYSSCSLLSAFGCTLAILLILCFRMYKLLTHRLILYHLLSALFYSISNILQVTSLYQDYWSGEDYQWCIAEAFLLQYSNWAMLLATLNITLHMTGMVIFYMYYTHLSKLEPFYILFPLFFPALIVWIPLINNDYGISGPWCWIKLYNENCTWNREGMIEEYALWYGEFLLSLVMNSLAIILLVVVLCKRAHCGGDSNNLGLNYNKALKQTLPIIGFPIIYQIIGWMNLANRTIQAKEGGKGNYALWLIHSVSAPSHGFFASVMTIIYLAIIRKFKKEEIRKVVSEWCGKNREVEKRNSETQRLLDPEDHITNTVTIPTTFNPPNESAIDDVYSMN